MMEESSDSAGILPLIHRQELEAWRIFKTRFNLKDALFVTGKSDGVHHTWRHSRSGRLIQSRIDRFYLSNGGWWMDSIENLKHHGAQALSDHDPVILTFWLTSPFVTVSCIKKTSPFKANPAVLKFKGAVEALQEAWDSLKDGDKNPHYMFNTACRQLQEKYMALQQAPKEQQGEIAILKAKLQALKQEILDTYFGGQVEELVSTEEQVQTLGEVNISHHKRLSQIHWLGEGNEPSKFYFATLKAKMQRESMPILLLEDSQSVTGDAAILTEVTRNYTEQFAEPTLTLEDRQLQ
jgi:hypothetical protein